MSRSRNPYDETVTEMRQHVKANGRKRNIWRMARRAKETVFTFTLNKRGFWK